MNGSNSSSSSSSKSEKALLQPVTYSMGYSLPPQANWQSAVAALQVRRRWLFAWCNLLRWTYLHWDGAATAAHVARGC
jgi:hypothetical protein